MFGARSWRLRSTRGLMRHNLLLYLGKRRAAQRFDARVARVLYAGGGAMLAPPRYPDARALVRAGHAAFATHAPPSRAHNASHDSPRSPALASGRSGRSTRATRT